ncbi:MAG TPA: biopolymer transporter ExbD [Candidatus Acidoferrales bacterium]|nr:biopolymer transporter ExbD [Candidatus Acidoferrales bacterium]
MGMAVGKSKGVMADPNIVPLIDVLLVLIIIFMVITPTVSQGLDTIVPQPPPPNQKENQEMLNKTIVVVVGAGGDVMINQDKSSWDQLGPTLTKIFAQRAEKVAFVKGDDATEFSDVARAISIMRASGIDHVGLITNKVEAGQ